MTTSLLATCLAAAVSACVGTLVGALLQGLRKDDLRKEVAELKNEKVAALAADLKAHVSSDRSLEFSTKLETVIAQNNEILRDLKKLDRETGAQGERIKATEDRIGGVHSALRKHTDDRGLHHG